MDRCDICPVRPAIPCARHSRNHPAICERAKVDAAQVVALSEADHAAGRTPAQFDLTRKASAGPPRQRQPGDPLPPPGARVVIRTFWDDRSGFGRFGIWIGRGLEAAGVPVAYDFHTRHAEYRDMEPWLRARDVPDPPDPWRLDCNYLAHDIHPPAATVRYTMHEVDRIPPSMAEVLNRCEAVIVPTHWNAEGFAASGVTVPIHVVPAGVSAAEGFTPGEPRTDGPTRFLMAGRLAMGGVRKGICEGVCAWKDAFPDKADDSVRLEIKLWPDCRGYPPFPPDFFEHLAADRRIKVIREPWSTFEMADWLKTGTALLAPTKGEGVGLHTLEAMACGLPIVAPLSGATAELVPLLAAYPIDFKLRPAEGYYSGYGARWAVPSHDSMIEQLRAVHYNRDEALRRGRVAAAHAGKMTWEAGGVQLKGLLELVGLYGDEAARRRAGKVRVPLGVKHPAPGRQ